MPRSSHRVTVLSCLTESGPCLTESGLIRPVVSLNLVPRRTTGRRCLIQCGPCSAFVSLNLVSCACRRQPPAYSVVDSSPMEALAAEQSPSVSALSAWFFDSAGSSCRGPWTEVWCNPFERAAPVRSFPSFKRQKNFTGLYYAATMGAHVGFESWLERDVAMMLDFDSRVVAFSSQPFWLGWSEDGEERQHAPDFFARLADGTGAVIDVRPDDRIKPRDARAFAVAEAACPAWAHLPMVRARRVSTAVSNGRVLRCTWARRSPPWSVASRVTARSSGSRPGGSCPPA